MGGGGILLVAGSGAYFSVVGERPFNIGAADDDLALLRIDLFHGASGSEGDRVDLLELTNRFDNTLTQVDVTIESIHPENVGIEDLEMPGSLEPGESGVVSGVLEDCSGQPPVDVTVGITVLGEEESVDGTRTVEDVRCEIDPVDIMSCDDILGATCAYEESGSARIENDRDGSVCIDGENGPISVDTATNIVIDGFLRIVDAGNVDFNLGNNATIHGATNLYQATGDIDATLGNNSFVEGEFCVTCGGNMDVDVRPPQHPEVDHRVGGDLKLNAGDDLDLLDVGNNVIIEGSVTVHANGSAEVIVRENAEIHGDVSVDAGPKATVTIGNHAFIDGDLEVSADGDTDVTVRQQAEIGGKENY